MSLSASAFVATLALVVSCTAAAPEPRAGLQVATFTSSEAAGLANAYLVSGERDAILVDAVQTRSEATRLADWIAASKKNLTLIFITHAHADHLLGLDVLAERFPGVPIVATPRVSADAAAREAALFTVARRRWNEDGPRRYVVPEALEGDTIHLEGAPLKIIEVENAESSSAAMLLDPQSRTLFASDLVGSGVHLNLREKQIAGWLRQLDALAQLDVARFLPGHGPAGGKERVDETRRYLDDFTAALQGGAMPDEVLRRMRARYPRHRLEENLERSVASQFPG